MPNLVFQDIHVVGAQADIDRFVATGFIKKKPGTGDDDVLDFKRLCPLRSRERKDTYISDSGLVLRHFRTRTQALFSIVTAWEHPAEFYKRLPNHWPELAFVCSINEDMEQFGGVLMVLDGVVSDRVEAYGSEYDARAHARAVRAVMKQWFAKLTDGRDWRLMCFPGRRRSVPFDVHFDDDQRFYFRSREELARFKRRYESGAVMRRHGRVWKDARVR
ncbi:MAG TPA: hypothetical protein VNJ02_14160 [Vicinamibacterales bacterium]|nr:hypothetical protein [Vicinamibacterales bacterium]